MNKWQIICPVVAMALVTVFGLAGQARRNARYYTSAQTEMIGQELVSATNSPRLVAVGPDLQNRLARFLASPGGVAKVLLGDEPSPIGDGTACSRLVLSNAVGGRLGIRLGPAGREKFQALGFWTLTEPGAAPNGGPATPPPDSGGPGGGLHR